MKYYTGWSRSGKFVLSKTSLEDNPLIAFTFGEIEAENEQEAEQKSKVIFAERLRKIGTGRE